MTNTDRTKTRTMRTSATTAAGLGLAAVLAAGCAALDDGAPDDEPELASAEGAATVVNYARWDYTPGVGSTSQLRLIGNADGRLALFSRAPDGTLRFSQQVAANGSWTSPAPLDGSSIADLEVVRQGDGRLGVLALGGDRQVYYRTQTSPGAATFTSWINLGAGTGGATDLEVAQHADGRVAVFLLGGDRTIWSRTQTAPGGGFGAWESHYGASTMMRVTSHGGRIALAAYTTVNTFYVKEQAAANGPFGGWRYAGQHALTDFDVTRLTDGRLHLAYVSPSDAQRALRWVDQNADGTWTAGAAADTGPHTAIELLEQPNLSPIAFTTGTDGHARFLPYSFNSYASAYDLAGPGLVDLAPAANQDGRMEVFGRTSSNAATQTWQTATGLPGAWRRLPSGTPALDPLSATPSAPLKDTPVDISWRISAVPVGCTPTLRMSDDVGVFYSVASLTSGTARDGVISRDTTYTAAASCAEYQSSGLPWSTTRTLLVRLGTATTPPGIYETLFGLGQDQVYSGPITHSALVFPYSTSSTLLSLWYGQTLGAIKLLPPGASNYDCENPSAGVLLAAQTWATPAQIAALYGTSTPVMPVVVRACSSAFMTARYDYQP